MKYRGMYIDFETPVVRKSLREVRESIEKAAGYVQGRSPFAAYYTAAISEHNFFGLQTALYHFSKKKDGWVRVPVSPAHIHAWNRTPKILKAIAKYLFNNPKRNPKHKRHNQ